MISDEKITRKKRFRQRIRGRDAEQIKRQGVWRKGQALRSTDQRVEVLGLCYT